jgi:hypothetical protein
MAHEKVRSSKTDAAASEVDPRELQLHLKDEAEINPKLVPISNANSSMVQPNVRCSGFYLGASFPTRVCHVLEPIPVVRE